MARPARAPAPVTCPSCGWVSLGAPHFCQKCGLDFWRVAAGEPQRALHALPPPPIPDRRINAALVTAGLAGLIVAAIATAVFVIGSTEEERPQFVNTRPTARPGQYIVERFFREARSPDAAYVLRSEGTVYLSDPPSETAFVEVTTMVGDSYVTSLSFTADGVTTETGIAEVDGEYFLREGSGEWHHVRARQNGPDGPFARISTVADVEYAGAEIVDGVELHHLVITKWLGDSGSDWRLAGFGRLTGREGRLDVWVTEDGVPIRATQAMTHQLTDSIGTYVLRTEEAITFENWGLVDPIQPPVSA